MIQSVKSTVTTFKNNVIIPPVRWVKNNTRLITALAVTILLAAACYSSPQALDLMKKNVKFLSIALPIAYTLPVPVIGCMLVLAEGVGYPGAALFDSYCQTVAKAWQTWFTFVGLV